MSPTDWKPRRRQKTRTYRNKLLRDRVCRCGCGRQATDAHHILLRSQGGDDVQDNVMPLYHDCHMAWHAGELTGLKVTVTEQLYVLERLGEKSGQDYLIRRGYVTEGSPLAYDS